MAPIVYSLVGLFAGAVLVGLIAAVMIFFRELRSLKESVNELKSVIRTLSKDNTLADSLKSFGELVQTGQSMMRKMDVLNTTIELFYKVAVRSEQQLAAPPAVVGDTSSEVYPYDEEQAAQREAQMRGRRKGVGVEAEPAEVEIESGKAVKAGDV